MAKGTTLRNVRLDDETWQRLKIIAAARGTDRSEVIRAAVEHCASRVAAFKPLEHVFGEAADLP